MRDDRDPGVDQHPAAAPVESPWLDDGLTVRVPGRRFDRVDADGAQHGAVRTPLRQGSPSPA
ncbi:MULTISPECIES: hypothetical protein [unclassified Streptomyces]|uniref:hypothetical protein n=1 Tax=unclassified Streptomyces TaxID=2593676 RepID=UPI00037D01C3|nr:MULTISPECIES: hypothetical protein [unclassified Streptomyces]MYY05570.1 hypothetical protein [Streptomyces sp. SID4913]